jgi:hypothetical protein
MDTYIIVTKDGEAITHPNETGSGKYISVMSKDKAKSCIATYYSRKGYKAKKIKTTP